MAALFWRGSTKWGALAVDGVGGGGGGRGGASSSPRSPRRRRDRRVVVWRLFGLDALARTPGGTAVFGFMPVVPMVLVSALLMAIVSALTPKPSAATIAPVLPLALRAERDDLAVLGADDDAARARRRARR